MSILRFAVHLTAAARLLVAAPAASSPRSSANFATQSSTCRSSPSRQSKAQPRKRYLLSQRMGLIMSKNPVDLSVIEHLAKPPSLRFPQDQQLVCKFPNRAKHDPVASGGRNTNPILSILSRGMQPFYYDLTDLEEWEAYFRSTGDQAVANGNAISFITDPQVDVAPTACLNASRNHLSDWFIDELVASALEPTRETAWFITGRPGSGKSTVFKYLLNLHRGALKSYKICASRFEFSKYHRDHFTSLKPTDVARTLKAYLGYILLRDLILTFAYNHDKTAGISRSSSDLFPNDASVFKFLEINQRILPATSDVSDIAERIIDAIGRERFDFHQLKLIDGLDCLSIARKLIEILGVTPIVFFDGLDAVSLSARKFDTISFRILEVLLQNFAFPAARDAESEEFGARERIPLNITIKVRPLFILRERTFADMFETPYRRISTSGRYAHRRLKPLHHNILIANAVNRGVVGYYGSAETPQDRANQQSVSSVLIKIIQLTMRDFQEEIGLDQSSNIALLDIFDGDIRDLFELAQEVAALILEDGRLQWDHGNRETQVALALRFLKSDSAKAILKRRAYRMVEFLLTKRTGIYSNKLRRHIASVHDERQSTRLRKDGDCKSDIDNIFNYHVTTHSAHGDAHCLLEKLRIVQCATGRPRTSSELATEVANKVGYLIPQERRDELISLLEHTGFLRGEIAADGDERFIITPRGVLAKDYFVRNQNYLEHIFHRTLFPTALVEHIADVPRVQNADRWTLQSIRNAFIFLAYVNYVEGNKAGSMYVPKDLRIFASMQAALIESTTAILERGSHEFDAEEEVVKRTGRSRKELNFRETRIGVLALQEINHAIERWKDAKLVY